MELEKNLKIYKLFEKDSLHSYFHNYITTENSSTPSNIEIINNFTSSDLGLGSANSRDYFLVLAHYNKKPNCYLLYKSISIKDIKSMLYTSRLIQLSGCYINKFDVKELTIIPEYKMIQFHAICCFWDNYINLSNVNFEDTPIAFVSCCFNSENISFEHSRFGIYGISITNSFFNNTKLSFNNAHFNIGHVSFNKLNFSKSTISFNQSSLTKNTFTLTESIFNDSDLYFAGSEFNKCGLFINSNSFKNKKFSFESSKLNNSLLHFDQLSFDNTILYFSSTNFGESDVNFSRFKCINGEGIFNNANFGNSMFNISYSNFNNILKFYNSTYGNGKINFNNTTAKEILFINNTFTSDIILNFNAIDSLYLINCINKALIKISGVTKNISFKDSSNLGYIETDWKQYDIEDKVEYSYLFVEYLHVDTRQDNDYLKILKSSQQERYRMITHDFLILKENYRNIGQYDWEDEAYRAYMKYNTKLMKWISKDFWKKLLNSIFGAISGYGTRVENILASCLISILVSGAIYCNAFYNQAPTFRAIRKSMYFSTITFLTIGYGDLSPIREGFSDFQTFWTGFEGFTGLLLMSMVTVVIMRKILR